MPQESPLDNFVSVERLPLDQLPVVIAAYHGVVVACSLKQLAPDAGAFEAQAQAKKLGLFESVQTTEGSYSRLSQLGQNVLYAMLWNLTHAASEMAKAASGEARADPKVQ